MEVLVEHRRRELGLTQQQVADRAGVGQHTVSDIETGRHIPRVDVAILIARALGSTVEELFQVQSDGRAYPL